MGSPVAGMVPQVHPDTPPSEEGVENPHPLIWEVPLEASPPGVAPDLGIFRDSP